VRKPRIAALLGVAVIALAAMALAGCSEKEARGCTNGVLTIRQSHVALSIKGVCDTLVIDGSYVHIKSNNANRDIVNGDHNTIDFVPYTSLTVNGSHNQGTSAEIGTVKIHGDYNDFSFDGSIGSLTVEGNNNYIDSDETIAKRSVKGQGNNAQSARPN
jgi:PBP1b-binding outer membrane lipoprotein LpoB